MKDKIRVGFVGCGQFCKGFVPLFKAHPAVEFIAVCDKFPERAKDYFERFKADRIYDTFEDMVKSDELNTIAIFSQRDTHGWMAIEALKAGKNVYSAVPMALDPKDIFEIIRLVKETGLTYSMGEMVYAEAQYNHDMKHLYDVFKYTEGDKWRMMAGLPPFFYPTHSSSMILSAGNTYAKKVSAFGYVDKFDPDIFGKGKNWWDNPFSNSSMLLQLANGAVARISENRRVAWNTPPTYISCFNATKASYECSLFQHSYITMPDKEVFYTDVSDIINPTELTKHRGDENFTERAVRGEWSGGEAPIQIIDRLPNELAPLPTNHAGTHKFMVDDFCSAYWTGKLSPTNAWQAAKYNLPGLIAHQSALEGGILMDVPYPGDIPEGLEVLSADRTERTDYTR